MVEYVTYIKTEKDLNRLETDVQFQKETIRQLMFVNRQLADILAALKRSDRSG